MQGRSFYAEIKKPRWAPPARIFAPVWTILYVLIALSYGHVGYLFFTGQIVFITALPFALNLIFNLAYSPIQFVLRNYVLGSLDIVLILATLVWEMLVIYPFVPWVAFINIPYLLWVSFATVLQLAVMELNAK